MNGTYFRAGKTPNTYDNLPIEYGTILQVIRGTWAKKDDSGTGFTVEVQYEHSARSIITIPEVSGAMFLNDFNTKKLEDLIGKEVQIYHSSCNYPIGISKKN